MLKELAKLVKNKDAGCLAAPRRVNDWFSLFPWKFASRCGFGVMHCLFHLNQSFKFTVFSKAFYSSFKMYCFFPWKVRLFLRSEKKMEFMQEIYIYTCIYIYIYLYLFIYIYLYIYLSIYLSVYLSIYIHVLVHRTLNIVISMRDNDNMSNDESAISFLRSLAPQRFRQLQRSRQRSNM